MKGPDARHRFFVESLAGGRIALSAGEAHHALHVLRLRAGAMVEVFDGAGGVAVGAFLPTGRKAAAVEVTERRPAGARPGPAVELAFAVPKGRRLDWLIEKATELGAAALQPVIFERSVAGPAPSAGAPPRWRSTCIAAARQCRADFLPEIRAAAALTDYLAGATAAVRMLGDRAGEIGPADALADRPAGGDVAVLVGPEGGLTDAERKAAIEAGFVPVRLGRLILRTDTAAVALLAVVAAGAD